MSETSVHAHLLACAAKYAGRAANPVTAWDCMGAKAWVGRCETLASEVLGLSNADALAHIIRRRDNDKHRAWYEKNASPWSFLVTLDLKREMDVIVDAISYEHCGWIESASAGGLDNGKMSNRPAYRRMLGINQCVAYCARQVGESDDAWQERRVAWLNQYHPDIHVTSRDDGFGWGLNGGQCTSLLGRVREFANMSHSTVSRDTCVECNLPTKGRQTAPHIANYSTERGPMCGMCHLHLVPDREETIVDRVFSKLVAEVS